MSQHLDSKRSTGLINGNSHTAHGSSRQSNHEDYRLPDNLMHLSSSPLYLAVAHFGLMRRGPVSRQDISQAFFISTRRALEVMRYLIDSAHNVQCERLPPGAGEKERGYRLHVHAISCAETPSKKPKPRAKCDASDVMGNDAATAQRGGGERKPKRAKAADERKYQELRRWFLQRPTMSKNGL